MKVLVVDAAVSVRSRLIARLREAGLDVVGEAASSVLACAFTRSLAPEAIILDVLLPDRRGLALITELKLIAPATTLLVLTNAPSYRDRCLKLGADFFLDKSLDFDAVAATLRTARGS